MRTRINSSLLAFAAALLVLLAVAAQPAGAVAPTRNLRALRLHLARDPAAGRVLGGITDQGWPVVMAISKNERQLVGAIAGFMLSCSSGQQFSIEDAWSKLRIGAQGAVHASAPISPASAGPGISITGGSHSVTGKLDRRTGNLVGVWRLQVNFNTSSGPDQCDSGRVAFRLEL